MKASLMRPPVISDIYHQKMTYQNHLKKLSQIRLDRKHQLQNDHLRNLQLNQIKSSKSKTFASKFNETSVKVNQSNLKFLVKLQKVKPYTHYDAQRSIRQQQSNTFRPVNKKKIIETERQNSRIYFKMKSVSSTLGRQKMKNDFQRAQKIRERITKYAIQDNKVELKSQKFFSNRSRVSNKSLNNSRDSVKRSIVSHYRKEDILKNKIESRDRIFKNQTQKRALPTLKVKQSKVDEYADDFVEQIDQNNHQTMFATQPDKKKRVSSVNKRIK